MEVRPKEDEVDKTKAEVIKVKEEHNSSEKADLKMEDSPMETGEEASKASQSSEKGEKIQSSVPEQGTLEEAEVSEQVGVSKVDALEEKIESVSLCRN